MCTEVLSSMIRKGNQLHKAAFMGSECVEEHLKYLIWQVINYEKFEISFSASVEPYVCNRISELLSVREVVVQPKYLGLPSVIGRSKKVVFQAILDKIKKKLGRWKETTLLIGGKEVLY
ncbi:hypothetical protein Tco_0021792 [Tanacetum coccineum]